MELSKNATLLFKNLIVRLRDKSGSGKELARALRVGQSTISRWTSLSDGSEITVKETTLLAIATLLGKSQQRVMMYLAGIINYEDLIENEEIVLASSEQIKDQLFFIARQLDMLKQEIQFCISGASGIKLIEDSSIRELIKSKGKDPDLISVKEYLELAKAITNQEKQEVLIQVDEKSFVYLKY